MPCVPCIKKENVNIKLADQIIAIFVVLLGSWLFLIAEGFPVGADMFPQSVLVVMMLLAAILFGSGFLRKRAKAPAKQQGLTSAIRPFASPLITFLFCVIYVALVGIIGYFIATLVSGVGMMFYLGVRRPVLIICSLLGLLTFIYVFFEVTFRIFLPRGLLF
ncbi:MAG: hypothetical protein DDT25_00096 [Chloroflexi bacterium]|nr:hypothetical protein [Chloroflexota bacterium]